MTSRAVLGIVLASLLAPPTAFAQAEQTTAHHHDHVHHDVGPHHAVHHHNVAPVPAAAAIVPAPQPPPFGLSLPHIAPYPNNKGDEDGLSEDQDDCNKGCIGGNTPD